MRRVPTKLLRAAARVLARLGVGARAQGLIADELWSRSELRAVVEWAMDNFPPAA